MVYGSSFNYLVVRQEHKVHDVNPRQPPATLVCQEVDHGRCIPVNAVVVSVGAPNARLVLMAKSSGHVFKVRKVILKKMISAVSVFHAGAWRVW